MLWRAFRIKHAFLWDMQVTEMGKNTNFVTDPHSILSLTQENAVDLHSVHRFPNARDSCRGKTCRSCLNTQVLSLHEFPLSPFIRRFVCMKPKFKVIHSSKRHRTLQKATVLSHPHKTQLHFSPNAPVAGHKYGWLCQSQLKTPHSLSLPS